LTLAVVPQRHQTEPGDGSVYSIKPEETDLEAKEPTYIFQIPATFDDTQVSGRRVE
jgi:hypothetical protein